MAFQKGQSGNPKGRPKKAVEEKYHAILVTEVKPDAWARIVTKAVQQAEEGDPIARKWLGDNLIGLPVQRNEVTGADGAALRVVVEYADDSDSTS
jgi:hypothetical protein